MNRYVVFHHDAEGAVEIYTDIHEYNFEHHVSSRTTEGRGIVWRQFLMNLQSIILTLSFSIR